MLTVDATAVDASRGLAVDASRGLALDASRGLALDASRGLPLDASLGPAVDALRVLASPAACSLLTAACGGAGARRSRLAAAAQRASPRDATALTSHDSTTCAPTMKVVRASRAGEDAAPSITPTSKSCRIRRRIPGVDTRAELSGARGGTGRSR